ETGNPAWSKNLRTDYHAPVQMWGFAGHPLVDGDKVICLVGGDAEAVAFHKDTGKELWKAPPVRQQGYCPPVIYEIAGKRQLILWPPEALNGIDPETGKVSWSQSLAVRSGLTIPMPRLVGTDRVFVTSFYNGPMMVEVAGDPPGARVVWKGKSS